VERTGASAAHVDRGDRTFRSAPTAPARRHGAPGRLWARRALAALALGSGPLVGSSAASVAHLVPPGALPRLAAGSAGVRSRPVLAGTVGHEVTAATTAGQDTTRRTAARRPPTRSASPPAGHVRLSLVRQSWTVGPGQSFVATVAVAGPASTAVDLQVSLWTPLHTRSGLAQADGGSVPGSVTYRSPEVPVAQLPSPAPGTFQLTLALTTPDDATPSAVGTPFGPTALACPERQPGGCGGVYPVTVAAVTSSGVVASLVTELVYAYPAASPFHAPSPLRTAVVLPLDLPPAPTGTPARAAVGHLRRVAATTTAAGVSDLPLTLVPEPAAVRSLAGTKDAADRRALAALDSAGTDPAHEVLAESYTPIDVSALAQAGLASLVDDSLAQACSTLAPWHPALGTWVTGEPVDATAAALLATDPCGPVRQLVVSPSTVSGPGCSITCTAPFDVAISAGTVTATTADSQLASEISAPTTDPVLQAHQVVADLSLTFYEAPAPAQPRGVVLAVPSAVAVSSAVVGTVLDGIAADPVLDPVTLTQYFEGIPVGGNGQPDSRHLVGSAPAMAAASVRALRSDLGAADAYDAAVAGTPAGVAAATTVQDALLRAASDQLRPVQQQAALMTFAQLLHRQLAQLTVSTGVIRLTSSTALHVPITFESTAGFPVSGTVAVSSDKLLFTPTGDCRGIDPSPAGFNGLRCPVTLAKATTAVYVAMRARIAGDFRLAVALQAPGGRLVLARGSISVRSMSASVEAIVLSAAALVVLATWWARTTWRRPRRGRHVAGRARRRSAPAGGAASGRRARAPSSAPPTPVGPAR